MKNVFRERKHTRWMTYADGRPFDPSTRVDYMTEAQFDRYLRAVKPSEAIQALCDRVDEIQRKAAILE